MCNFNFISSNYELHYSCPLTIRLIQQVQDRFNRWCRITENVRLTKMALKYRYLIIYWIEITDDHNFVNIINNHQILKKIWKHTLITKNSNLCWWQYILQDKQYIYKVGLSFKKKYIEQLSWSVPLGHEKWVTMIHVAVCLVYFRCYGFLLRVGLPNMSDFKVSDCWGTTVYPEYWLNILFNTNKRSYNYINLNKQ